MVQLSHPYMTGQGPHLAKRWEPRGFSRVAAAFSSYDVDLSLPLGFIVYIFSNNIAFYTTSLSAP